MGQLMAENKRQLPGAVILPGQQQPGLEKPYCHGRIHSGAHRQGDFSFYQSSFVHTILLSNAVGYTDVKKEDNLVKQMVLKNSPIGSRVSYK